jgi:hypothetical protein
MKMTFGSAISALLCGVSLRQGGSGAATTAEAVASSQRWVEQSLPSFLSLLQKQGWQLDKLYLPRLEWTAQW